MECRCGPSLFSSLDPRLPLVAAAVSAVAFSFLRTLPGAALALFFAIVLVVLSRQKAAWLAQRLAAANVFVLFLWLTLPFTVPGVSLLPAGWPAWTREGALLALLVTLKANAILLVFLALVPGLGLPRTGAALARLGVPAKLVFLFLFTGRSIHVAGEEWRRLWTAAELRGFVPGNSLHTYRSIGNMLGLTIIRAVDRSRRVHEAMLLRGFAGNFRTVSESAATRGALCFSVLHTLALAAVLYCGGVFA